MNQNHTLLLALLLFGIAFGVMLGAGIAYYAITDSIEGRAADGVPFSVEGRHYRITEIAPPIGNLTDFSLNSTWQT